MYPVDETNARAWPQIPFKFKTEPGSKNVPDWAKTLPNVFVSVNLRLSVTSDVSAFINSGDITYIMSSVFFICAIQNEFAKINRPEINVFFIFHFSIVSSKILICFS